MGTTKHHVIIVTAYNEQDIFKPHDRAKELFGELVTPINRSAYNEHYTFCICPDGSKQGRGWSDDFDLKRLLYKIWLDDFKVQFGNITTNPLLFFEVSYGSEYKATIEFHRTNYV